jgi:uncharacterized membrane protein YbhN (UPF0104 family)
MKKVLQGFKKVSLKIVDIQIKVILFLCYLLFFIPLGIFTRLFKDYLEVRKAPSWKTSNEIHNIPDFLKKQ